MTKNNLIPPPELVQQWVDTYFGGKISQSNFHVDLATRAAQWGAGQELEACCLWLNGGSKIDYDTAALLRAARRPKPPSLKEQAIAELDDAVMRGDCITVSDALPTIRRALEQLPE
jgi:hypothetical protein